MAQDESETVKSRQTGARAVGRSNRPSTAQRGGVVRGLILFFLWLFLLSGLALAAGGYLAYREINRPGPLASETVILFEPGQSVRGIAGKLADAGVIRHPGLFSAAVRARGVQSDLKAGEYRFAPGINVMQVIDILVDGNSILHFLTLAEGLTTDQILRVVAENDVLVGEVTMVPREGDLLPETYGFTRGESRETIVKRMEAAQEALIDDLWEDRQVALPLKTPREAIILASIVEKETGIASERDRVAAVFVNRLKRGMRLQSDPTIIYGLTKGEPLGRGLRRSELESDTPYNTYRINGLPPTPICNPGAASIAAVLNPADTDDLYFVADGSGGHAFAKTLREHNANVARWRQIERTRE